MLLRQFLAIDALADLQVTRCIDTENRVLRRRATLTCVCWWSWRSRVSLRRRIFHVRYIRSLNTTSLAARAAAPPSWTWPIAWDVLPLHHNNQTSISQNIDAQRPELMLTNHEVSSKLEVVEVSIWCYVRSNRKHAPPFFRIMIVAANTSRDDHGYKAKIREMQWTAVPFEVRNAAREISMQG